MGIKRLIWIEPKWVWLQYVVWKTQRHSIKIAINEWLTGAWCQVLQDHHPEANKQPAIKPKKNHQKKGATNLY